MAHWRASAEWAAGPALDSQCATLLGLALSKGLGSTRPPCVRSNYAMTKAWMPLALRNGFLAPGYETVSVKRAGSGQLLESDHA